MYAPPASRAPRRDAVLRLLLAWSLLAGLCYWQGSAVLDSLSPLLTSIVRFVAPQYTARISLVHDRAGDQLLLDARVAVPIPLAPEREIPGGTPVPARISVVHAWVPVVIFCSVVCAMPAAGWRERGLALAWSLPLALLLLGGMALIQLLGLIEMSVQEVAQQFPGGRSPPLVLRALVFLESGGRWLLPALAGLLPSLLTGAGHASDLDR